MPIRYMGTKRRLAPVVEATIRGLDWEGALVDLFCGTAAVAQAIGTGRSLWLNDAQAFIACIARARFCSQTAARRHDADRLLNESFQDHRSALELRHSERLQEERSAVASREQLLAWIRKAPHVGSSTSLRAAAARMRAGADYELAAIYFASSYFSTQQAIDLDSIRFAVDREASEEQRDVLLAAWLTTASLIANSPGHTAQFMKPVGEASYRRIITQWARPVWTTFLEQIDKFAQVGDAPWRARNTATSEDSIALMSRLDGSSVGVVYADPPYTSDQYSRYYHVLETLYLYDYPESTGEGRYRGGRHVSAFCLKTQVNDAFEALAESAADRLVPLIISYPSNGLLQQAGYSLDDLLNARFRSVTIVQMALSHSRMGSGGKDSTKEAVENVYLCRPS